MVRKNKLLLLFFVLLSGLLLGQNKERTIRNIHSDLIVKDQRRYGGNNLFKGKVVFQNGKTKFYCDSAVYYQDRNILHAWSRVRIKNDTIELKADTLIYEGEKKLARAFGNVLLKDRLQTVTSDRMVYNRANEVAVAEGNVVVKDKERTTKNERMVYNRNAGTISYSTRTVITNRQGETIVSEKGTYFVNEKRNDFQGNVNIETKDYRINTNRAIFDERASTTTFTGNTRITSIKNPRDYIITTNGTFNSKTEEAFLNARSTVYSDGKELHGNTIYANKKSGFSRAKGDVWLNDPLEKRYAKGDYAEAYEQQDSAFITGNAYIVKIFEQDSLYFHADTLVVAKQKDSAQLIRGYYGARFYKSNVQGRADSISFNEKSGKLEFYRDPVVWSGLQQITGDTIFVYSDVEKEITDSIRVKQNAFVIAKVDSIPEKKEFNQLKGRRLLALFYDNEIRWVEMEGNAQSITYMDEEQDNGELDRIGINKSDCGITEAEMEQRNVEILACRINTTSKLFPETQLPEKDRFLKGFNWREAQRLKKWTDIFIDDGEFIDVENLDVDSILGI